MGQAWYSSVWSLALHSVRRISVSSVGAHRLQTEFLCLLSCLWLQGLSTQYNWSCGWISEGRQRESCSKGFSDRAPKAVRTLSQSSLSFLKAACCRLPPLYPLHSPPASCVCNSKYSSSNRQSGVALVISTQGKFCSSCPQNWVSGWLLGSMPITSVLWSPTGGQRRLHMEFKVCLDYIV